MVASKKKTTKGRAAVRSSRSPRAAPDDPVVLITVEHGGMEVEKYFTTLSRVEDEYGDYHIGGTVWGQDFASISDEVRATGRSALDTKYRSVYVEAVTPKNVGRLTSGTKGSISYESEPDGFFDDVDEYLETGMASEYVRDFVTVTDGKLAENGYTASEIRAAREAQRNGNLYPLYEMWKEAWNPKNTPSEIYPVLEALGVPKRLYDPRGGSRAGSRSVRASGKPTPKSRSPASKSPAKKAPAKSKTQKIPGKKLRDGSIEVPEGAVTCLPDGTPLECDECGSGDCDLCVVEPTGSWRCRCWSCGNWFYEYPQRRS